LDVRLCWLTVVAIVSRPNALAGVQRLLRDLGASPQLLQIAGRTAPLRPMPPPGDTRIVVSRDGSFPAALPLVEPMQTTTASLPRLSTE
jgi:hypothetical protein